MIVQEAMTANPITVQPHSTVFDVAKLMRDKDIGSVIIAKDENVLRAREEAVCRGNGDLNQQGRDTDEGSHDCCDSN